MQAPLAAVLPHHHRGAAQDPPPIMGVAARAVPVLGGSLQARGPATRLEQQTLPTQGLLRIAVAEAMAVPRVWAGEEVAAPRLEALG